MRRVPSRTVIRTNGAFETKSAKPSTSIQHTSDNINLTPAAAAPSRQDNAAARPASRTTHTPHFAPSTSLRAAAAAAPTPSHTRTPTTPAVVVIPPSTETLTQLDQHLQSIGGPRNRQPANEQERILCATFTVLKEGVPLRSRTAYNTHNAPAFLGPLLATVRDMLQKDDAYVAAIHDALRPLLLFGVGITPSGALSSQATTLRNFHVRALELQAVLTNESPVELLHPDLLIEIVVGAIQSQSSAYLHGRNTRTEAAVDIVARHLEDIAGNTIDWRSKLQEAANAHVIAIEGSTARIL